MSFASWFTFRSPGVVTLQKAMDHDNAERNMIATVEQAFRLVKALNA